MTTELERLVGRKALRKWRDPVRLTRDGWEYEDKESVVQVLAVAKGYAMVRIPRCIPFVVPDKELHDMTPNSELRPR